MSFSYDPHDDASLCEHAEGHRLTYRNILRDASEDVCYDALSIPRDARPATHVPYAPPIPRHHPIDRAKLEEWRVRAAADAMGKTDRSARMAKNVAMINHFADNVRHISFEEFMKALTACFARLRTLYPEDRYEFRLRNHLRPTGEQKGNSERWLAEIVNHSHLYDIPSGGGDATKRRVDIFVEDAIYTGASHRARLRRSGIDVSIVPYVRDLNLIRGLADAFVKAETGETLHIDWDGDNDDVLVPGVEMRGAVDPSDEHETLLIFYEEMGSAPFYFDHKLADAASWRNLWMFRGLHSSDAVPSGRTAFIEGCEDGDDMTRDEEDRYYCPKPPYATS